MSHISLPIVRADTYVTAQIAHVVTFVPKMVRAGFDDMQQANPKISVSSLIESFHLTRVVENAGMRRKADYFPTSEDEMILQKTIHKLNHESEIDIRARRDNLTQSILANYISIYFNIPIDYVINKGVFNEKLLYEYLNLFMNEKKPQDFERDIPSTRMAKRRFRKPAGLSGDVKVSSEFSKKSEQVAKWTLEDQKKNQKNKRRLAPELEAFLQM